MRESDIENAEQNANTTDVHLKARKVLSSWREQNGQSATRRTIIDALTECELNNAKEILAEKWGINLIDEQ